MCGNLYDRERLAGQHALTQASDALFAKVIRVPAVAILRGAKDGMRLVIRRHAVVGALHHRKLRVQLLRFIGHHRPDVAEAVAFLGEKNARNYVLERQSIAQRLWPAVDVKEGLDRCRETAAVEPVSVALDRADV